MMKCVKKILCVCLVAALLLVTVPVTAAGTPAFVVSETSGKPGDTVTLTVSTRDNPGIVGLRLNIAYDSAALELKKADGGDFKGATFGPLTKNPFTTSWVDAIHPDNKTNGVVVKLTFAIKASAPAGKSVVSVSFDQADVFNLAWEDVIFTTVSGGVTVTGTTNTTAPTTGGSGSGDGVTTDKPLHNVTESDGADRGLGFLFTLPAKGVKVAQNGTPTFSGATISYKGTDCTLVQVGALLTTNSSVGGSADKMIRSAAGVTDVAVNTLWGATASACSYAVRLKNIPDSAVGRTVYARPYYVVKYQGKDVVVYGSIDATTYQKNRK